MSNPNERSDSAADRVLLLLCVVVLVLYLTGVFHAP